MGPYGKNIKVWAGGHISATRLRYSNSQELTSKFSGVGFFTLIQGISTATYLTLPRLPRRTIGPDPFQYSLMATPAGIEPALSDVTGRCFSRLNYGAI